MKNCLKILALALLVFSVRADAAFAMAGEPSVLLHFADETRFYRVQSSDVLSALLMEKLTASGKFTLRSEVPVDIAVPPSLDTPDAPSSETGAEMPDAPAPQEAAASAQTAAKPRAISPAALKAVSEQYGARYAIYGTIRRLETVHTVYRDLGNAASVAGKIADIFTGGILGTVLGAFGGAGTAKDTLGVAVTVRVLDMADGQAVWEKDFASAVTIPDKNDPDADMVTAAGVQSNATLAKALDAVAEAAVKALIEEVGQNRLLIK